MEYFDTLSLASRQARELHSKTGQTVHVACIGGGDWFITATITDDMQVWRSFTKRLKKK